MVIKPALQTGLEGIQRGVDNLRRDAQAIAGANQPGSTAELTQPLVNLKVDQLQVAASVEVVKTLDETLGTLLDIKV